VREPSLKVLVHCVYYPPEVGGLESHVQGLCRGLSERGHRVTVVTSLSRPDLPREGEADGVRILRTPLPSRTNLGWFLHAAGSVRRARAAADTADVAHAPAFASVLPCRIALAGRSTPLVTTLHTSHFLRLAARRAIAPSLGKLLESSSHNFTASKEIADVVKLIDPSLSAEVMVNGVDTDVFRPTPQASRHGAVAAAAPPQTGRRRLVVPRRLFPKNGVEFFVRAMPAIVQEAEAEALVIGDGPEKEKLQRLASELGVDEHVTFLGARPHAEMPQLLSLGELAVFPSLVEATSVAALESMACGLPVAASAVGGLPEIIDDKVGGLFPSGDPSALAKTVLALLSDPQLPKLGARARKRVVRQWSNDRLVERHLEVYRSLVRQGQR